MDSGPALRASRNDETDLQHPLYPALQLAQNQLPDYVHAWIAVVQAGNGGEGLTAVVLEYLGIFLRDLFQRFQAIGRKAGRDDGQTLHAVFGQLPDRLSGLQPQPRVEP